MGCGTPSHVSDNDRTHRPREALPIVYVRQVVARLRSEQSGLVAAQTQGELPAEGVKHPLRPDLAVIRQRDYIIDLVQPVMR